MSLFSSTFGDMIGLQDSPNSPTHMGVVTAAKRRKGRGGRVHRVWSPSGGESIATVAIKHLTNQPVENFLNAFECTLLKKTFLIAFQQSLPSSVKMEEVLIY